MLRAALLLMAFTVALTGCRGAAPAASAPPPTPSAAASVVASSPTSIPGSIGPWIAYQDDGGLRLVKPDGTQDHALEGVPAKAQHPDWSHDGSRMTFIVDEGDTRDIWIADADGANARVVFDCEAPCIDADGPAFSPDDRTIAFRVFELVDGRFPGSKLELLDVATGAASVVLSTESPLFIGNGTGIRWSGDGRRLVMDVSTIDRPGETDEVTIRSEIAVVDLDDPELELRHVTALPTWPSHPDWQPGTERIVFMARIAGTGTDASATNLFVVDADGGNLRQLTKLGSADEVWGPTWAPDGRSILVTLLHPRWTLGRMSDDGSGTEAIPGPVFGAHPRLQPVP